MKKYLLPILAAGFLILIISYTAFSESIGNWTPESEIFRKYYGWDDNLGDWEIQFLPTENTGKTALHVFTPHTDQPPKGTIFLLHGYLEHTALRLPLALEGVSRNWIAAGLDLPGHGLSEGTPFAIEDFEYYSEAFETVLLSGNWPRPWRVIAHSTGCSAVLLYLQHSGNPFELVILESPLMRSYMWGPSKAGLAVISPFVKKLPRRISGVSKDQLYYRQLINDPLFTKTMPVSWCSALNNYVDNQQEWTAVHGKFIVLFGEYDTAVDIKYGRTFLQRILPEAEIYMIQGGTHILLRNESPAGERARDIVKKAWINN